MAKATDTGAGFQAQLLAAGLFTFLINGMQRHAVPVCLSLFLRSIIITIELLGVVSLVVILLTLLVWGPAGMVRARIVG